MENLTREEMLIIYGALCAEAIASENSLRDWTSGEMDGHATPEKITEVINRYENRLVKISSLRDKILFNLPIE